jgi:hypothetical protein
MLVQAAAEKRKLWALTWSVFPPFRKKTTTSKEPVEHKREGDRHKCQTDGRQKEIKRVA